MGYGIIIKNVYIPGVKKDYLHEKLEEIKDYIKMDEDMLLALAAVTPHPVFYDSGEPMEWVEYVTMKVSRLNESIAEYRRMEFIISYALEHLEDVEDD